MAKKDKNNLLNIHYSRTMTSDNLSKAANYVGKYVLKGLGAFGKIMTAPFVQLGPTSATIYKSKELLAKERTIENKSEELLGKAMTWVSPLNYGVALATGNGLNARKGEEEVASWSPAWLAAARLGELYVGPKAVKGVKATPRVVVNTAAKAGVKPAKAAVVAREINKGIKQNTNNGRIEVTGNYFNSPDKWYRITETPEKYGIMELGKNVTTHDAPQTHGTINGWRSSMLIAPITKSSEGFIKRPQKIELGIRRKNGQAHGNTSQAAKGKLWGGTTSGSNLFPEGIIEGQAPSMINYGIDRTNFVMTPWELVPNGGRVGFHTGEMPVSNLGWFQKTNKGTYTYEPIIPERRIEIKPSTKLLRVISEGTYPWYRGRLYSVKEVVNSDGTVNPRQAMKILHEVSEQFPDSYKMEHRLENPEWHQNDPTTYQHTKNVALSAWGLDVPYGFTKHDLMVAALGHDFGKIVAGDGHAQIGADLVKQVFPDLTEAQYKAIAEHMGTPKTPLGKVTKAADIDNGRSVIRRSKNTGKNNIVGASYDYRMEDSKGSMDFLKQFFALLKINGKEYTLEGLRDAVNVQQGLPEHIQSYLNLNTVERAVRAMRKNGYSEREILLYIDKVNEEMNKVKVGMYSDLEYNAAGALDFGGFYNRDTNFISINKDAQLTKPAFTPNYIMKHEGRHLIDYNTSMTDDVINILEKAYDKDFLEIPKHEDAGNLKDYLHMDRERVTTNRDAREVLLSNLEKHPGEFLNLTKFAQTSSGKYKDMVDFLNELILYVDPEDIVNAVENSNGYGKRYINYLKKNNKLTPAKIEQLRLAMIHVPSYLLPVAGGYTLYNLFNQPLQQLQYLKQGGKMNKLIKMLLGGLFKLTDYIKAIENPDSIGWNGRVWAAPTLKGYDKNQRGFGIDVNTNKEARALTEGRPGRWLTDREANTLMNNHINYITKAANKHIKGFSKLSPKRQAALLGMLYRGDSVNKSGINIYEPNDHKFFKSISNYYRSKGLNTRADNSDKFFNISSKLKMGGQIRKMEGAGKLLPFSEKQALDRHNEIAKQYFSSTPTISNLYNGAINWLKGHKILLPDGTSLLIGHPPIIPGKLGSSSFKLSKNASQGERIWKYLFDYVKKNPKVVEQSKSIPLGYTKGTEYTLEAKLPLEGLSVRNNTPLALENRVMNPAEKAAAEDYLSTVSRKINEEFPDVYVNTKLPTGRPSGEFRYPKEILEKYGFGKPKTTVKSNNVTRNTNIGNAKLSLTERYHDRKNYSRKEITLDKNNRAYETGKATPVNSGQSRVKIRLLENVSSNITKYPKHEQRALDKLKLKLAKKGLSRKEIERHKDIKAFYRRLADQYGYFKNGGLLEFLKNGSGIHIKKKNRGKFTEYCGGKVTQECIRKAKASGNPTLVKRATFADNARHFKHLLGGNIIFPNDSNPNAFGGVFENVLLGRLRDLELQYYRKKLKEQQALIDLLLEQLKSDVISNILGTAVNTGLNYLLKSKQEKAT